MGEQARPASTAANRTPLSRERIVAAAVALADELTHETDATGVSMRAIARRLGVEAMSLYGHVSGREDILDGMVDAVFAEIDLPAPHAADCKSAMRARAVSSRAVLQRHRWAIGMMDSRRRPGPATLRHHDAVLGALRAGGFSVAMAAHAFSVIDSYLYGFVLQELSLPFTGPAELDEIAGDIRRDLPADTHPHLTELITEHALKPGYDYGAEFEFGLSLILDALRPDESRPDQTDVLSHESHSDVRVDSTVPGRPKADLVLSDQERARLQEWVRQPSTPPAWASRCRIILACAAGGSNKEVAAAVGTTPQAVGRWRARFVARRIDGLGDMPRPGGPRTITDEQVAALIARTLETPPPNGSRWSTRSMAEQTGLSQSTVSRIWRAHGLHQPGSVHR